MQAADKLSGYHQREGTLRKVVEQYEYPKMYSNANDSVEWFELCERSMPLWYDKLLKSLAVSHLWQWMGINILHMPKTEDWFYLPVVARESLSRWAETQLLIHSTLEIIAVFSYMDLICWLKTTENAVVDRGAANMKWTNDLFKHYNI